jgi:hypothetical protein
MITHPYHGYQVEKNDGQVQYGQVVHALFVSLL